MTSFKVWIIITTIGASSFLSVGFVDNYFELSKNLDIFATLFRELNMYYVDETKPGDLMKKAIDSMLESLDPYTNYIPETEIEDYRFLTTGQYGGIGSFVRKKDDYIVITDPHEGYPAQKADLRAGDIILEVDGKSVKNKTTDEVTKFLKGQPNTVVKILIKREGEPKPIEKTLTREEIKINSVSYSGMLNENIGYISLTGFTENASQEVKAALLKLKENKNLKGIVLDLRGNPGGLLNEAVNIVNLFVEKGQEIVTTKGKLSETKKIYKALNNPVDTEIPITVLVNSGSASASEIVSGSLQDLDRAVVVGQRSFGKGLVQQTKPLSYNSQLKITVAKYYTPSGRCIQALDYSHRNEDGSVGKIPDSLMTEFKTRKGRSVFDGGGVKPDVNLSSKQLSKLGISLLNKHLIFDYATKYKIEHPTISPAKDFVITDEEYNKFITYLSDKDYDYITKSEKMLADLKEAAQKEKYYELASSEFEALKKKLNHNKKEDLVLFKDEIKELLQEEIASRYYYQKGRVEAGLNVDKEVKKAIEIIDRQTIYSSILNGKYKDIEQAQLQEEK